MFTKLQIPRFPPHPVRLIGTRSLGMTIHKRNYNYNRKLQIPHRSAHPIKQHRKPMATPNGIFVDCGSSKRYLRAGHPQTEQRRQQMRDV
jgi:hypothetical protein